MEKTTNNPELDKAFDFVNGMQKDLPNMRKGLEEMSKQIKNVLDLEKSIESKNLNGNTIFLKEMNRVLIQFPTGEMARNYYNEMKIKKLWWKKLFN